jgi:hypothetical protein
MHVFLQLSGSSASLSSESIATPIDKYTDWIVNIRIGSTLVPQMFMLLARSTIGRRPRNSTGKGNASRKPSHFQILPRRYITRYKIQVRFAKLTYKLDNSIPAWFYLP